MMVGTVYLVNLVWHTKYDVRGAFTARISYARLCIRLIKKLRVV